MSKLVTVFALAALLVACENMYPPDDGIPRIRSQRQVDAYNDTVSSEGEKLVCTRETLVGSNLRQFICMTLAQRDRLALQARENLDILNRN